MVFLDILFSFVNDYDIFRYLLLGPNYHCGFSVNPAILTGPTHLFSDGSTSTDNMLPYQSCEWRIDPVDNIGGITLLFYQFDMRSAAALNIYTVSLNEELNREERKFYTSLSSVNAIPAPISVSEVMYISYQTGGFPIGTGFLMSYFSAQGIHTESGNGMIDILSSR